MLDWNVALLTLMLWSKPDLIGFDSPEIKVFPELQFISFLPILTCYLREEEGVILRLTRNECHQV